MKKREIPKSKVEDKAISILQDFISNNFKMKEQLKKGEKGFSVDGPILIFQGNPDLKKNYYGEVQTQVKGKTLEKEKHKETTTYSISNIDIENYFKYNGIIFFVILIDWENNYSSIYYKSLLPINLKIMQQTKKTCKSQTITLKRVNSVNKLEVICRDFINEQEKQASFKSMLLSDTNIENVSLKFYHTQLVSEEFISLNGEEKTLYKTEIINGKEIDFPITVAKITYNNSTKFEKEIKVGGKTYYEYIEKHDKESFKFGSSFIFNLINSNLDINICGNLNERIKDSKFLLDTMKNKAFYLGDTKIDLKSSVNIKEIENCLKYLTTIKKLFEKLNIEKELDFNILTKEDDAAIFNLVAIMLDKAEVKYSEEKTKKMIMQDFSFANIKVVLFGKLNEETGKYKFENIFNLEKVGKFDFALCNSTTNIEKNSKNPYLIISVMSNLLHYDNLNFSDVLKSLELMEKTNDNYEIARYMILKILEDYEDNKNEKILILATDVAFWMKNKNINVIDELNYYKCIKKNSALNKIHINRINKILKNENECNKVLYICYELLDNSLEKNRYKNMLEKYEIEELNIK